MPEPRSPEQPPPPLVRACSWCQSEGPAPGQTHGICAAHAADVLAELCGLVDDRAGWA